jgi:WhiB family redox-sensing transcriptional regulator
MPDRRRRIDAAKAICGSCPVVAECRTHALTVQEPYGIWGGMSERDRAALLSGSHPCGIPHDDQARCVPA